MNYINLHLRGCGRTRRFVILLLMIAFSVASYLDRTIMAITGPFIMQEFRISEIEMGSVYSAFLLGYVLLMVPGGRFADWFGPARTLTAVGLGAALFTGCTAVVGSVTAMLPSGILISLSITRFAFGVVSTPLYPACARMSRSLLPRNYLGRAQASIIAGASLGASVSPLLFHRLMDAYRWREAFWWAAAVTATLAVAWHLVATRGPAKPRKTDVESRQPSPRRWRRLVTNRNLILLTLAYFTVGYFEYIFFYWIYYYFGHVRRAGFNLAANQTTVVFLAMLIMMPLGGWLSDRLTASRGARVGRVGLPIVGLLLGAALLYTATLVAETSLTVALMALALGFVSFCEGPFWALAANAAGDDVGAAGGILNMGGNVGGFFAPVMTPWIASGLGWKWGLYSGCFIILVGAIFCCFIKPEPA